MAERLANETKRRRAVGWRHQRCSLGIALTSSLACSLGLLACDSRPVPEARERVRGAILPAAQPGDPQNQNQDQDESESQAPELGFHDEAMKAGGNELDEQAKAELAREEPEAEEEAEEQKAPEKRDFSAELVGMMGNPASCLQPKAAQDAPPQLSIRLSATVMPSGAVGRGEVHAAGLSAAELACMRKQLEALRFSLPIEDAPFTVTGTLELEQQPAPPSTQTGTEPEPQPGAAEEQP